MRKQGQAGFTLIELMIVVMIMGILLAIAIPTLSGQREHAKKAAREAQKIDAPRAADVPVRPRDDVDVPWALVGIIAGSIAGVGAAGAGSVMFVVRRRRRAVQRLRDGRTVDIRAAYAEWMPGFFELGADGERLARRVNDTMRRS